MSALICGSLAFDTIAHYGGRFTDTLLSDQPTLFNTSLQMDTLHREYGACAGNIAYSFRALGGEPIVLALVGSDGEDYLRHLQSLGIDTTYIAALSNTHTAQCIVMIDGDGRQISAFYPGVMRQAHRFPIPQLPHIKIGILAPNECQAMLLHAQQMQQARIPFIFDPGQSLPQFETDALNGIMSQADWIAVNQFEGQLLCEKTGLSFAEISQQLCGALFVTLGAQGSDVWQHGQKTHISPFRPERLADLTGCGDAYRSALLYGLERHWPAAHCAGLGNQLGAIKAASPGAQNHQINADLSRQFAPA